MLANLFDTRDVIGLLAMFNVYLVVEFDQLKLSFIDHLQHVAQPFTVTRVKRVEAALKQGGRHLTIPLL